MRLILWPAAAGKSFDQVLFYLVVNSLLDIEHCGVVMNNWTYYGGAEKIASRYKWPLHS